MSILYKISVAGVENWFNWRSQVAFTVKLFFFSVTFSFFVPSQQQQFSENLKNFLNREESPS